MSDDNVITLEEVNEQAELRDLIENQIMVINEVIDQPGTLYDTMDEDRIKVVGAAYQLIYKLQRKILKSL